jgi:hypothetical protein
MDHSNSINMPEHIENNFRCQRSISAKIATPPGIVYLLTMTQTVLIIDFGSQVTWADRAAGAPLSRHSRVGGTPGGVAKFRALA